MSKIPLGPGKSQPDDSGGPEQSATQPPVPAIPLTPDELAALHLGQTPSGDPEASASLTHTDLSAEPDLMRLLSASGRVSTFGGPLDTGMKKGEGLSVYEPHEAAGRPDLFNPLSNPPGVGISHALNPDANYIAIRFPLGWNADPEKRKLLQETEFEVVNPSTGKVEKAALVDWGPHHDTGRAIDMSPGLARKLGLRTNDIASVRPVRRK